MLHRKPLGRCLLAATAQVEWRPVSRLLVVAHLQQHVERGAARELLLELVAEPLLLEDVHLPCQLGADVLLDDARVAQVFDAGPQLMCSSRA